MTDIPIIETEIEPIEPDMALYLCDRKACENCAYNGYLSCCQLRKRSWRWILGKRIEFVFSKGDKTMVIVVAIMTIVLVAALGVICYQRMMVDRLNESWESAFENVSENLEACVQTLKSELEVERRWRRIWRTQAQKAWHEGFIQDIPEGLFDVKPFETFGGDAVREATFETEKTNEYLDAVEHIAEGV